jgi:thymidylate kinase
LNKPTRFIQNWVAKDIERWSRIIRGVILLKAANNVVLERINSRSQEHFIKRGSDEEASRFLGEYTSCYDKIFAIYRECGVPIKEVDTSSSGVDEVKASVVEFID